MMDIERQLGEGEELPEQPANIVKKEPETEPWSIISCSFIEGKVELNTELGTIPKDVLKRKLAAEREKQRREIRAANETPEERAARRARENERERIMRQHRKERVAERTAAANARKKAMEERQRERELLKEQRKLKTEDMSQYYKEYRRAKRQNETLEEKERRTAREAERYRRKCLKKMLIQIEATSGGEQGLSAARRLEEERQKLRERDRQNRIVREARMTPEQKEARRIKMKEKDRLKRARLKMEMPEKAAAIRARINARRKLRRQLELEKKPEKKRKTENKRDYNREYRKKVRMMETPEEKEARLAKDREAVKLNRTKKQEARRLKRQSQLEAKKLGRARTVKTAEEKREQRRKEKAARYARLTPEQREQERLKRVEWLRQYRDKLRQTLTPEQKEFLVKKNSERTRLYRQKQKQMLTLEQRKEKYEAYIASLPPKEREARRLRREQMQEIKRQKLKEKLAKLTPEERAARSAFHREYSRLYRQKLKEKKMAASNQQPLTTDEIKIESENLQETWIESITSGHPNIYQITELNEEPQYDESYSWFERSEGALTTGHTINSQGNECLNQKSYQHENSTSSYLVEDALDCMREIIEMKAALDRFSIYGEHIANQIRSSGRDDSEIYIAKQRIDNVIENLSLDCYSSS